jgi:hypothetical protein
MTFDEIFYCQCSLLLFGSAFFKGRHPKNFFANKVIKALLP